MSFDNWRKQYLERELHASQDGQRHGDRFRVLAAVLRYEIIESLPELEQQTRNQAAQLWKELGLDQKELPLKGIRSAKLKNEGD